MSNSQQRLLAVAFAVLVVGSGLVGAVGMVAAQENSTPTHPSGMTEGTVTLAKHNVTWSDLAYENDNGEVTQLDAHVNESVDNPYSFETTEIAYEDATAFPHGEDEMWSNTSLWSATGASVSEADSPTEGVEVAMSSTGDYATYTLPEQISSDESKKYLQLALDVKSLSSSGVIEVRAVDADGDYKVAYINASRSSGEDFITNATGDGLLYQRQMGKMDTMTVSGSDGTFNDIDHVNVTASAGTGTVRLAMVNLDKMERYSFGSRAVDTDDDDALESETIYEIKEGGAVSVSDIDTLGDTFDAATIHNLKVDVVGAFEDRSPDEAEWSLETTGDERPGYHGVATVYIPTGLVSAYDVSWADTETRLMQTYLSDRYLSVKYAEAIDDTDPMDVDSWSDITSSYDSQGENVTVDDTVQPGQNSYLQVKLRLQEDEYNALQTFLNNLGTDSSGTMGPMQTGGGGNWWKGIPIVGTIVAFLGAAKKGLFSKVGAWLG
jgi:hypothetical protein